MRRASTMQDDERKLQPSSRHWSAVTHACRLMAEAESPPTLDALAAAVGLSRYHFHRIFKALTGLTPKAYAAALRAGRVRAALVGGASVTETLYDAGFSSSGRFYENAMDMLGMAPTVYRDGGAGIRIRFALGDCSLGTVLVAVSDKGVCAIDLGDDPEALVRNFQDRFPRAELIGNDPPFEQWVAEVVGFVEAPRLGLGLPLDVRGTVFQQRVWQALSEIPVGSTATYTEIATKLGMPRAVRAVARACAANPLAVAIPCHRVIRTDGSLAGYRWGVERKRALLERESSV